MRKAKFPALGSIKTVPFYTEEPKRGDDESTESHDERCAHYDALQEASIDVRLVDRETAIGWAYRYDLWASAERKRKADLERAGQLVPSGITLEGLADIKVIHLDVVKSAVVKVRGIVVGDVDLENADPAVVADLLAACVLLTDVARMARAAQEPTPTQLDC